MSELIATTILTVVCVGLIGFSVWTWRYTKKRWDNAIAYAGCISAATSIMLLLCRFVLGIPLLAPQ